MHRLRSLFTRSLLPVAALVLGIAPYAWCALSGMEVAFASALLVGTILLLLDTPRTGRPSWKLILCLAATSLSRPELTMIAGGVVAIAVLARLLACGPRPVAGTLIGVFANPRGYAAASAADPSAGRFVAGSSAVEAGWVSSRRLDERGALQPG